MGRSQVMFDPGTLTRKERKILRQVRDEHTLGEPASAPEIEELPFLGMDDRFRSIPRLSPPPHVGTGWDFAAANPFAAADLPQVQGPVVGVERLSGGRGFILHPWHMYLLGMVSSPNILVKGSLRRGKSFIVKRLVTLLALFNVYSINTSDVKGEHGVVAEALGGQVFKVGSFGTDIRVNPLQAGERHFGESEAEHTQRMLASRQQVLQLIGALLAPGSRNLFPAEIAILNWALSEVIRETNDHPTIRKVIQKIDSPELTTARGGMFEKSMARDLVLMFDLLLQGNLSGMFEDEGTIQLNPESPYTVFDTYAMEKRGDLALAITQTITNSWVQNMVSNKASGRRHLVIREEGWRDMKTKAALEAHELQLKLSGEYGITMMMIVHEDGDFDTGGEEERNLAQKLLRGYANTITFYQNESTLKRAVQAGTLRQGEANLIRGFGRGEFMFRAGERSYVIDGNPTSTPWERQLFDTDAAMRHLGRDTDKQGSQEDNTHVQGESE
ncbi:ATP-binding protein [Leucobacter aridicollis]